MGEKIELIVGIDKGIDYGNYESTSKPWEERIVSK